jgi:phospholipid/cholesterol/gamma-HCH transport system permease protein
MTAIISSGRSGASFAAEIGTMKVSEEIDALKTLGVSPVAYLVIPRLLGVLLVMPLLVIIGDVSGIVGGMVLANLKLDVSPMMYLTQLRGALEVRDVLSGLTKSVLFGFAVVFVACQRGLATDGGAEGVGRSTTGAVVSIIFALILLDAAFTVILGGLSL